MLKYILYEKNKYVKENKTMAVQHYTQSEFDKEVLQSAAPPEKPRRAPQ